MSDEPPQLIELSEYVPPRMPADESVRRLRGRFWEWLNPTQDDPLVSDRSLRAARQRKLRELAGPPACGPVQADVEQTYRPWLNSDTPARWMQVLVVPGCEESQILRRWGENVGAVIVEPPSRQQLLIWDSTSGNCLGTLSSTNCDQTSGPIVLPRLEDWFVRHHRGLEPIRHLLDELANKQRHCIVGCNSWAWSFLSRVVGVDLLLPSPLTLKPFSGDDLRSWFASLAETDRQDVRRFRLTTTGDCLLQPDEYSPAARTFFETLAALSLGVPWVAWHLWRDSLRLIRDAEEEGELARQEAEYSEEETIWVTSHEPSEFPRASGTPVLLMLHALLLHGGLTRGELSRVLPSIDISNVLAALVTHRLVKSVGDRFVCVPGAYPAIRSRLIAAGVSESMI